MSFSRPALAAAGVLLFAAHAAAEPTRYPLTLENCQETVTFEQAPETVVSVGQAATEILYSLDLADKVTGTSVWFNQVLPEFEEVNSRIERMADNDPSFESVLAKRPDLVAIQFLWHIGPQGIVGTRGQLHDLAIPTYVLESDCADKIDNAPFTTQTIYQSIEELAQIFDIQDRGEALVAELRGREEAAIERAQALDLEDVSAVFWFSSADMEMDPYVAGDKGTPAYMMEALGVRNVVEAGGQWPTVGWETIARANPTLIVIAEMDRRRFPADDHEVKLDFLRTDPVTQHMDAVKENRIVIMNSHAMDPSIRAIAGIEILADALVELGIAR